MSSEDLGTMDDESEERESRLVVFPTVVIPFRVMYLTAAALVGAAGLAVIAALIRAIAYMQPSPQGFSGVEVSQPPLSFADRVSIFTREGAGITIAILVALAVVVSAIADRSNDQADRVGSVLLMASTVVAAVIVAANAIMFVEVLASARGIFLAEEAANKASSAIGHLEPILLAVGAIWYSATRLRADWAENESDEPQNWTP
jgi:hypothetical protein